MTVELDASSLFRLLNPHPKGRTTVRDKGRAATNAKTAGKMATYIDAVISILE